MNRLALKFLNADGRGVYSNFEWPLPHDGKPGKWVEVEGSLIACHNGIHACTLEQALSWLNTRAYVIELGGEVIDTGNKLVARRGRLIRRLDRWDDTSARLFAADCAERVLPLFESKVPLDDRPRRAIEAARALARGEVDVAAVRAAANAARAAVSAKAAYAAHVAYAARAVAAYANYPDRAVRVAAAASAAADAADAAGNPDAERRWQADRLAHYLGLTPTEREAVS